MCACVCVCVYERIYLERECGKRKSGRESRCSLTPGQRCRRGGGVAVAVALTVAVAAVAQSGGASDWPRRGGRERKGGGEEGQTYEPPVGTKVTKAPPRSGTGTCGRCVGQFVDGFLFPVFPFKLHLRVLGSGCLLCSGFVCSFCQSAAQAAALLLPTPALHPGFGPGLERLLLAMTGQLRLSIILIPASRLPEPNHVVGRCLL